MRKESRPDHCIMMTHTKCDCIECAFIILDMYVEHADMYVEHADVLHRTRRRFFNWGMDICHTCHISRYMSYIRIAKLGFLFSGIVAAYTNHSQAPTKHTHTFLGSLARRIIFILCSLCRWCSLSVSTGRRASSWRHGGKPTHRRVNGTRPWRNWWRVKVDSILAQ